MCYSFICYVLVLQHCVCWCLCQFPYIPKKQEKRNQFFLKINKVTRGPSGGMAGRGRWAAVICGCRSPEYHVSAPRREGTKFAICFPAGVPVPGFLGFEITYMNWQNGASKVGLEGFAKKKLKWDQQFLPLQHVAGRARKTREDGSGEHPHDTICFSSFDIKIWSFNINFRRQIHRNIWKLASQFALKFILLFWNEIWEKAFVLT